MQCRPQAGIGRPTCLPHIPSRAWICCPATRGKENLFQCRGLDGATQSCATETSSAAPSSQLGASQPSDGGWDLACRSYSVHPTLQAWPPTGPLFPPIPSPCFAACCPPRAPESVMQGWPYLWATRPASRGHKASACLHAGLSPQKMVQAGPVPRNLSQPQLGFGSHCIYISISSL